MATPNDLGLTPVAGATATVDGKTYTAIGGQWVTSGGMVAPDADAGGFTPTILPVGSTTGTQQPFGPATGTAGETDQGFGRFTSAYTPDPSGSYGGTPFKQVYSDIVNEQGEVIGQVPLDPIQLGIDPYAAAELAKALGGTLVVNEGSGPLQLSIQFGTGENFNAGLLLQRYATYPKDQADAMTAAEIQQSSVGSGAYVPGSGSTGTFTGISGPLSFAPTIGGGASPTAPLTSTPASVTASHAGTLPAGANATVASSTQLTRVADMNNGQNILAAAQAVHGTNPMLTVWEWNWYRENVTGAVGFDPIEMGLSTGQRYDFQTWFAANNAMEAAIAGTGRTEGQTGNVGQTGTGITPGTTSGGTGGTGTGAGPGAGSGGPGTSTGSSNLFWAMLKGEGASFLLEAMVYGAKAMRGPYWSKSAGA